MTENAFIVKTYFSLPKSFLKAMALSAKSFQNFVLTFGRFALVPYKEKRL